MKWTTPLLLARLLATTPLALASQSPTIAPSMRPAALAEPGAKNARVAIDPHRVGAVSWRRTTPTPERYARERFHRYRAMSLTFRAKAAIEFAKVHANHRDALVFWGTAVLSALSLLF